MSSPECESGRPVNGSERDPKPDVSQPIAGQIDAGLHIGCAVAIRHNGVPVADFWGGTRSTIDNPETSLSWAEDTLALSYSTTKGVASTVVHRLAERGALAYDEPGEAFGPDGAVALYRRMLELSYPAIKAVRPDTTIIAASQQGEPMSRNLILAIGALLWATLGAVAAFHIVTGPGSPSV